ncbi:MAG: ribosome small subunit-dependent GTPase A [Bacilli bacterium]|nr:ribosome small subunit-dependent GTPase A [Bacilli bacterium]
MRVKGQIIKNISDTYDCLVNEDIYTCKCRGNFRHKNIIPMVGDFVFIDTEKKIIEEIMERKNSIIRPRVSNITKAFVVTSFVNPDFSTNLLDKLLTELEISNIIPVIIMTKMDLASKEDYKKVKDVLKYYEKIGYKVLYNTDSSKIKDELKNNTTVLMGQTGAGKSTLLNKLFKDLDLKTGEISMALGRGKHTTRHVEIIVKDNIKVIDTPGFSALSFLDLKKEMVRDAFVEFKKYPCPYNDCMHIKEAECNVIKEVKRGNILNSRYLNYKNFIDEFGR